MSAKSPLPYEETGLVILDPYGELWSSRIFDSEEAAKAYLRDFGSRTDLDRFKIVPGQCTTRVLSQAGG